MRYPYDQSGMVQNLMERVLRPFVGLKGWDYCVLWKLSEDQRYIELMDCCCAGTDQATQNGGDQELLHFPVSSVLPCRDVMFDHPRTKSCEFLAQLPSSIPLNSGIHEQTLSSNLPRWLNFSSFSDSSDLEETVGTRALIPVPGGLMELFIAKQVPEDQQVIDVVTSQCNFIMNSFMQQFDYSTEETKPKGDHVYQGVENGGASAEHSHNSDCNDDEDDRKRNGKGPQSKNLVAERKRRRKLNDRLYALRALVPNISKLDRASILGDAIEYVKELLKQVKDLQDELEENSDDEGTKNGNNNNNVSPEIINQNGLNLGSFRSDYEDSEITHDKGHQMEAQVEVTQKDENEFFVKVFCEHKPGGFARLMEALDSLGFEVTNTNVISNRGLVTNVFNVVKDCEMVQADYLRDSLLELTRNPPAPYHDHHLQNGLMNNFNDQYFHHL